MENSTWKIKISMSPPLKVSPTDMLRLKYFRYSFSVRGRDSSSVQHLCCQPWTSLALLLLGICTVKRINQSKLDLHYRIKPAFPSAGFRWFESVTVQSLSLAALVQEQY